jgi:hypothetical protein
MPRNDFVICRNEIEASDSSIARYLSAMALPLILMACGPMVTFIDMESSLNADVGQPAPDLAVHEMSWRFSYRDVDSETYELTSLRPDACNYAYVVRKKDKTIIGWHFLRSPPPTGCKFQRQTVDVVSEPLFILGEELMPNLSSLGGGASPGQRLDVHSPGPSSQAPKRLVLAALI